MSCVMCHMSSVTSQLSTVNCHQRQQPKPQTLPLLTPPLCTVDWLTKTEPKFFLNKFKTKKSRRSAKNAQFCFSLIEGGTKRYLKGKDWSNMGFKVLIGPYGIFYGYKCKAQNTQIKFFLCTTVLESFP